MIVVGKETRSVHVEISSNEQADVVKRCDLDALKVGLKERIEESILKNFNKNRSESEKAEWISTDALGNLCFMREQEHYHGSSRTEIISLLDKKDVDKLESLSKILSVFN